MMLDIADALALILERSSRRTELQIPPMFAFLFALWRLWRRGDGYPIRECANRNVRNHGVGCSVDDRDDVEPVDSHVGSGSVWGNNYEKRIAANRTKPNRTEATTRKLRQ
jgi:hypothetical protein